MLLWRFLTVTRIITGDRLQPTRDKQSAEEIVQNLFIGLWDRREVLVIERPANYLATGVKFAFFKKYYRKQKREASLMGKLSFVEEYEIEVSLKPCRKNASLYSS